MDPYIIINYAQNKSYRTKTIKKGGTEPRWENEHKIFGLPKVPSQLQMEVWDHEMFKRDDLVGKGEIEIK